MRIFFIALAASLFSVTAEGQSRYQSDFQYYWQSINENFAYFHTQHIDWKKVKDIYQPIADTVSSNRSFVRLLETVNNELYNGHVFLNTNTSSSNRTIPTGADLQVSFEKNRYLVAAVREGFNAEQCGIKPGMEITHFNGVPVAQAVKAFLPKSVTSYDKRMYDHAANMLLAGTHDVKREITVKGYAQPFKPDSMVNRTEQQTSSLLDSRLLNGTTTYIRINNSLGENDLIRAFDSTLNTLMNTTGLILDLRETPSGGNTTIARAIMGRFTSKTLPYQQHIYTAEEKETGIPRSTLELVSPRHPVYTKPLVVLVDWWTGSMGEGMAIGFDAMKRATIMGRPMAGLLGENYTFEMPATKIRFSFPCVQLKHVNGTPRENYKPGTIVNDRQQMIPSALALLKK